jgi:hypothetical protein
MNSVYCKFEGGFLYLGWAGLEWVDLAAVYIYPPFFLRNDVLGGCVEGVLRYKGSLLLCMGRDAGGWAWEVCIHYALA